MNRLIFSILILIFTLLFAISCAGLKSRVEIPPEPVPADVISDVDIVSQDKTLPEAETEVTVEAAPETAVEKPEQPGLIMGKGLTSAENMEGFLLRNNPQVDSAYVQVLAQIYIEEAAFEGVNHDIAFSQMCLETGFLRFGGLVQPEWNNFCGLGAIGPEQPGLVFPDPRTGVRAHIQHLKAYATEEPLKGELVDPRYRYVRKGSSPAIEGLSGTWAVDRMYAVKINDILQRLYDFSF